MNNRACHLIVMPSHGNTFCITGPLWGESIGHGGFSSHRLNKANVRCYICHSKNKLLKKQSSCWCFEITWHSYDVTVMKVMKSILSQSCFGGGNKGVVPMDSLGDFSDSQHQDDDQWCLITLRLRQKTAIFQMTFSFTRMKCHLENSGLLSQPHSCEWKCMNFNWDFTKVCS